MDKETISGLEGGEYDQIMEALEEEEVLHTLRDESEEEERTVPLELSV